MKALNRRCTVTCLVGAALGLLAVTTANAQTCYRLTDLKALGFPPFPDDISGINNAGEVAFTAVVNGEKHAFVWLPQPNYGFATGGLKDLHVLAGLGADEESAAHDINEAGFVAGSSGNPIDGGQAIVWQLGSGTASACELGHPSCPDSSTERWAVAFAINDADPPVVIGDSDRCFVNCADHVNAAFRITLDGCPSLSDCDVLPLCTILEPGNDESSFARDINTRQNPPEDPQVVGFTDNNNLYPNACIASSCQDPRDAVRWEPAIALLDDLDPPGQDFAAEGRGNNNNDQIVGSAFEEDSPCRKRAIFWEPPLYGPFNLGELPDVIDFETRAQAINNLALPQVVGSNQTINEGLIWERQSDGSWEVTNLNTVIDPCSNDFEIRRADDIGDNGWIITVADADLGPGFEPHAVLLTPLASCPSACEGDLNGDCCVDNDDLAILIAAAGPCPALPAGCPADLDCDGKVGRSDAKILILNFGPCPITAFCTVPPPGCDSVTSAAALGGALAQIGFADVDAYAAWVPTASETEAFVCNCVLHALLEAQP